MGYLNCMPKLQTRKYLLSSVTFLTERGWRHWTRQRWKISRFRCGPSRYGQVSGDKSHKMVQNARWTRRLLLCSFRV